MQTSVSTADDYYAHSLLGAAAWAALTDETKEMALATAELDINVYLGVDSVEEEVIREEAPFSFYQCAVFEWALYLATNSEGIANRLNKSMDNVTMRKVDGFGTEAYGQATKDSDVYNDLIKRSRAGRFLRAIHTDNRIIR